MMQLTLFFVTLWALSSQNIAQAEDPFPPVSYDKRLRPSAGKTAHEEVTVNTLIKEILSVDETTQTSELDVYVTLKWKDSRLKWDVQKEGRIQKRLEADSVWVPGIDFDNAVGSHLLGKQSIFVQGDSGLVEFRRRFQIVVSNNMDFHNYPFDTHQLIVDIRCFFYNSQDVIMLADKSDSKMRDGLDHTAYSVSNFEIDEYVTGADEPEDRYAGVRTVVKLERKPSLAIVAYIIPLVVVVLMSMMQLWMHLDRFDVRVGLASTAMLAIMMNAYVVLESLPNLSYLTWMHWFLMMSMFFAYSNLVQAIFCHWRELDPKKRDSVKGIEGFCQIWIPVAYAAGCFLFVFFGVSSQKMSGLPALVLN